MGFFGKQKIDISQSCRTYEIGKKFWTDGQFLQAQEPLLIAATQGNPFSVSTLTWQAILLNDPETAIEVAAKHSKLISQWAEQVDEQFSEPAQVWNLSTREILNIQSNIWLANYLIDGSLDLDESDFTNTILLENIEAKFLAIFAKNGQFEVNDISPKKCKKLIQIFETAILDAKRIQSSDYSKTKLINDGSRNFDVIQTFGNFISALNSWISNYMPNISFDDSTKRIENYSSMLTRNEDQLDEQSDIAEPSIDSWFQDNAIQIQELDFFESGLYEVSKHSMFNVETAKIFLSTYYPIYCECTLKDSESCSLCGRSKVNFVSCMSANSDGDFIIYDIRDRENGKTEGIFLPFILIDNLDHFSGAFEFEFSSVAPIEIATLKPHAGKIFIGDLGASLNSNNFVSSVDSHGEQSVIAWVGYKGGLPTPLAITVTGSNLTEMIKKDYRKNSKPTHTFQNCINESQNGLVGSRLGAAPLGLIAEINENIWANRSIHESVLNDLDKSMEISLTGLSWIHQFRAQSNTEEYISECSEDTNSIYLAYALKMRGANEISEKLLASIREKHKETLSDKQLLAMDNISKNRTILSGIDGPLNELD